MPSQITYIIDLTPENADKIAEINKILTVSAPKKAKQAAPDITLKEFKEAAKTARRDFGEDFAVQVLENSGIEVATTLGRSIGKPKQSQYTGIIAEWAKGVKPEEGISPAVVKEALKSFAKAHSREEARKIMTDNGAEALSAIDECTPSELASMMSALA